MGLTPNIPRKSGFTAQEQGEHVDGKLLRADIRRRGYLLRWTITSELRRGGFWLNPSNRILAEGEPGDQTTLG